ncbi:thioredoxin family protein [Pontiella sp.]|uniref:thioredoxin family protein n=1 Tax=Pontiella sp. TaxID=2837462 RepID=UPI0035670395
MKAYAVAALALGLASNLFAENPTEQEMPHAIDLAPSSQEFTAQLAQEIIKAKALQLTPFIQVSAEWCGPCRRLHASMDDPLMIDAFRGTYVIRLDADKWREALKDTAYSANGIPAFIAIDDTGKPVGMIDGGAWGKDIPQNMAPPLKKFFTKHQWAY